ncbi:MAG: tyrosine-protein phosphatase [Pseudomonadota bacterium]
MQDRIKPLTGVRNFRDFGGYPVADGGRIRPGLLYRSGHYAEATDQDVVAIDAFGIAFQVDLRRPDERERQPGKWSAPEVLTSDGGREMNSPHVQFLTQIEADVSAAEDWMNSYYETAPFKPHHVELFTGWFDRLAGLGDGQAALVNCAAGKDRTGILCALTKHVLGASRDDITTDYELTNTAVDIDARLPDAQAYFNDMLGKTYDADIYRPFMGVRRRYLETAFRVIEAEHGSLDAYLTNALNVTEHMRTVLRARLVQSA